jgi:hypothetical protein
VRRDARSIIGEVEDDTFTLTIGEMKGVITMPVAAWSLDTPTMYPLMIDVLMFKLESETPARLVVVQHWFSELQRLASKQ